MKRLIFNADDFGFTPDVNAGIIYCHREGVLTATTLMANGEAFDDAIRLFRDAPGLDVGCHFVLVQGTSLMTGKPLPATPRALLAALALKRLDLEGELRAQVEKIVAAGVRPTHVDTHKHTHVVPSVLRAVTSVAREYGIPFVRLPVYGWRRRFRGVDTTDHFHGFRLTGTLTETTLAEALRRIPEGITEFMCHPGYLGPELRQAPTRLKETRLRELEALTSPKIRRLIDDLQIELTTFARIRSVR